MKLVKTALFVLALIVSGSAAARHPEPIVNYANVAVVAASGKPLSVDQVRQAVRTAAQARGWSVVEQANGKMAAALSWNGNKHTIGVDISCLPASYSIDYRDSINMKYGTLNGQPIIHPHYNRFVRELNEAIRSELMKL